MKFAVTTLALVLAAAMGASSAFAADPAPAKSLTPQQQKMKDCNKQAGDKKGDERKAFMSTCLKSGSDTAAAAAPAATTAPAVAAAPVAGSPPAPKRNPQAQREKMKTCNADASQKHLAGADRKSFMSTCLKGDSAAATAH